MSSFALTFMLVLTHEGAKSLQILGIYDLSPKCTWNGSYVAA